MSLESEVNADYRPLLEASTTIEEAQSIADAWLAAAQAYAERAGWTQAARDRLVQNMNTYLAPRLRDIAARGRTLTQEERWETYVEPSPWKKLAGPVVLAGGAVTAIFGLGWLALNIIRR